MGLFLYRVLCLTLIAQACFAVAGTLSLWRETLGPGEVVAMLATHGLLILWAGTHYVLPTPRLLGLGLTGGAAVAVFLWVGFAIATGPTPMAQLGRTLGWILPWVGLYWTAPRAVREWESSVYGSRPEHVSETLEEAA